MLLSPSARAAAAATALLGALTPAVAQTGSQQQQVVKPPQAQAWIDIATFSGMAMPATGSGGAGAAMGMALGSLFGGGGAKGNSFGQTQGGAGGRWVDVTLYSRANARLAEAQQSVPAGFLNAPLKLQAPPQAPETAPEPLEERDSEPSYERPRAGC